MYYVETPGEYEVVKSKSSSEIKNNKNIPDQNNSDINKIKSDKSNDIKEENIINNVCCSNKDLDFRTCLIFWILGLVVSQTNLFLIKF